MREFPSATSNQERSEITKLLNSRYSKFGAGSQEHPSEKRAKAASSRAG